MNTQNDKEGSTHVRAAIITGIFAVIAACIGGVFLVIIAFINNGFIFAGAGNQNPFPTNAPVSTQPISTPLLQPTTASIDTLYNDWVICWHGRDGYEYLIAYPENEAAQGISLNFNLTNAQGRSIEVANDSLKMCYVRGEWYGYPDPSPWFPAVSYFQLLDGEVLVCSDSPGCKGSQWTMLPENYFPSNAPDLQAPNETGIHIIVYKSSK
ncbi:MAG: hypothetical protein U0Z26_17500 [Anaerolineales bacterium]